MHTGGNFKKAFNIPVSSFSDVLSCILSQCQSRLSEPAPYQYHVCCFFAFIENRRQKNTEQLLLYRLGRFVIPLVAALFVSQIELGNLSSIEDNSTGGFSSVTARIGSIGETSDPSNNIRLQLWGHALDYGAKHPLMGCGYGNWKIASIPYIRVLTDDLYVPVHAHNDFVEAFAELGIPGGLLYLALFACILVFTVKTFRSGTDNDAKLIAVFSFLAFLGYSVDAFFNFPMERPINQVFFVLICALNIIAYINSRPVPAAATAAPSRVLKPAVGLFALLIMLPSAYVMYRTYQSLVYSDLSCRIWNTSPCN
jgi:O-antigen ligase